MKVRLFRVPVVLLMLLGLILISCQEEDVTPAASVPQPTVISNPVIDQPIVTPADETGNEGVSVEVPAEENDASAEEEAVGEEPAVVEEPASAGETQPVEEDVSPASDEGETVQHEVQQGDWLLQIARCYGADYTAVRRANPQIWNPNWIKPGAIVTVPNTGSHGDVHGSPCVAEYTVALGDTWLGLAERFGTTAVILRRVNPGPLLAADKIFVPAHNVPTE